MLARIWSKDSGTIGGTAVIKAEVEIESMDSETITTRMLLPNEIEPGDYIEVLD